MTTPEPGPLEQYLHYVEVNDAFGARRTAMQLLWSGMSLEHIIDRILSPTQREVGQRWAEGELSIADERAATRISMMTLRALTYLARAEKTPTAGHVVVSCAEGENHTLPAAMVAAVADAGKARVTTLGPLATVHDAEELFAGGGVDLLALTCTAPANLLGAERRVHLAHRYGIPVLAGGRAFGATAVRAYAIGADAWADRPSRLLIRPFPRLAGRVVHVPREAVRLHAVDDAQIEAAHERALTRMVAPPASATTVALADNLTSLAQCTASAMLTSDITILDDELVWLSRLAGGSTKLATSAAHALAETIKPSLPVSASMLENAAHRLADRSPDAPSPDEQTE